MSSAGPEVLVDYQSAGGPTVLQVRGALLVSSVQTLRELSFFPRYLEHLAEAKRDEVLYAMPTSWVPTETAMAHYAACDAMNLVAAEMDAVGAHVAARIMGSFIATLMRSTRVTLGLEPLIGLRNYGRLWDRLLVGGGCKVSLTGPKDAIIESRGVPMFRLAYFRTAYAALIKAAALQFARTCHVRILRGTESSSTVMLSWV